MIAALIVVLVSIYIYFTIDYLLSPIKKDYKGDKFF